MTWTRSKRMDEVESKIEKALRGLRPTSHSDTGTSSRSWSRRDWDLDSECPLGGLNISEAYIQSAIPGGRL